MKHIKKEHLLILLALAMGWILHGFVNDSGAQSPILQQAAAQGPTVLAQDDGFIRILTTSDDGKTVAVWVFSQTMGNIQSMPALVNSAIFTAK